MIRETDFEDFKKRKQRLPNRKCSHEEAGSPLQREDKDLAY
jgi:hypothetical protein